MQEPMQEQEQLLINATINIDNLIQKVRNQSEIHKKNVEEFATLDQHNAILASKINSLQFQSNPDITLVRNLITIQQNLRKEGTALLKRTSTVETMLELVGESKRLIDEMNPIDINTPSAVASAISDPIAHLLALHESFYKKARKMAHNWNDLFQKITSWIIKMDDKRETLNRLRSLAIAQE